jgi:hypothetical protein
MHADSKGSFESKHASVKSMESDTLEQKNAPKCHPTKVHITVQHDYHDHSSDIQYEGRHQVAKGGVVTSFLLKVHSMLESVEKKGLNHVASWQPHGR